MTHTRRFIAVVALLVTFAAAASAQPSPPVATARPVGTVDVGFRTSDIDGDAARFQRYQDIRDRGASVNFALQRDGSTWAFRAHGKNLGYRDQQLQLFGATGRVKVSFEWNQTPLFYANTTATAYVQASPGVFTLDPAARLAVQNGTALGIARTPLQAQSPSIYRSLEQQFDLRSRRDTATFKMAFAATRELGLNMEVNSYTRSGAQPWGAGFAFTALPEVPVPLDNRTTDVSAGAEWAHRKGVLRLGYQGSFFSNEIETLTWDNPLRATDYTSNGGTVTGYDPSGYLTGNGAAQGRMALAPSNASHGVSGLGMMKLPARTTLTGTFGVVGMKQDAALIPWTINSAIADPRVYALFPGLSALDRATADADVRVTNANLNFSTRPTRQISVTAKYRYFERDDRTPAFDATEYVRFDAVPMSGGATRSQLDMERHTVNVDATIAPARHVAFRLGAGRDTLDHARAFSQLADTSLRAAVHVVGHQYVAVRAIHEHTRREASGLDTSTLALAGAQPASRWYDDADRTRNRTSVLLDITPTSYLGLNGSAFIGKDTYDEAGQQFGLLSNDNIGYTAGLSLAAGRGVSFGATYGYERYSSFQRSRNAQAPPDASWSDPSRDWHLDNEETVHTVGVNLDLLRTLPKTEIRVGYDWTDSDQGFVYGGPRIDALAAVGQFAPLPAVTNAWQRATFDARYFVTRKVGIGGGYWFHKFEVNDYQTLDLGDGTPRTDYVGSLMLGYGYRPFNANTGFIRVFYLF